MIWMVNHATMDAITFRMWREDVKARVVGGTSS